MAVNGMYIVQGEMTQVIMSLRRTRRWSVQSTPADEQDPLLCNFADLRDVLNTINDLSDMSPSVFLSPFLEVIRSEHTHGPVTGLALSAIAKFLSYGLIDPCTPTASGAVQQVADAVTHARFIGTDPGSDEVVLLKILQVLKTLMLTPVGSLLTNESVCEILQSCFRICFESRLSELLRRAAEYTLQDVIQLLFTRLPTFKEDLRDPYIRKLKMRAHAASNVDTSSSGYVRRRRKYKHIKKHPEKNSQLCSLQQHSENDFKVDDQTVNLSADTANSAASLADSNASNDSISAFQAISSETVSDTVSQDTCELQDDTEKQPLFKDVETPYNFEDGQCHFEKEGVNEKVVDFHANLVIVNPDDAVSEDEGYGREHSNLCEVLQASEIVQSNVEILSTSISDMEIDPQESNRNDCEGTSNINNIELDLCQQVHVNVEGLQEHKNRSGVSFSSEFGILNLPSAADEAQISNNADGKAIVGPLVPYGLPCIRELFRFLISLTNPWDQLNNEAMIQMGLNLLTVALEAGADYLGSYVLLLPLIKDDMCRNLMHLLQSEKMGLFAATLRACFILFEALRTHLKLQLEVYLSHLMNTVISDKAKISFEQKEAALEALVQLWRIPGLVTELYLNYDCDLYCSNLFEDLTKLLSKNSYPVQGIFSTHILSLDALLTVIDTIEAHCHYRSMNHPTIVCSKANENADEKLNEERSEDKLIDSTLVRNSVSVCDSSTLPPASGFAVGKKLSGYNTMQVGLEYLLLPLAKSNRMPLSENLASHDDLLLIKKRKRILATGTELFNQSPTKGVAFLQEHGILSIPLNPSEVVQWLRENPQLDKQKIGDYISNKKNLTVLEAFVKSFAFENVRIDDALRAFLEAFRLPGEAPVISMLMEHFSSHWHKCNDEPFANNDCAFTLAFAIIMLNVDQHNTNAKKQNVPMTVDDFKRNLTKVNGGDDFDQELLEDIYFAIKHEEIVMPAEQSGIVRENYLWKVMLRRGLVAKDGQFNHAPSGLYDYDLFQLIWSPSLAAISYIFDKTCDDKVIQRCLQGFRRCAAIAAHYSMCDVFDNLVISLCKFSTLTSIYEKPDLLSIAFADNSKAQLSSKTMFALVHAHCDILRDGWRNICECLLQLYRSHLLPKVLIEAEDFVDVKGWVSIQKEKLNEKQKEESGLFSSLYYWVGGASDQKDRKQLTSEEQEMVKTTQNIIFECHPEQLISDSRYITADSLSDFFKAIVNVSNQYVLDNQESAFDEIGQYILVFFMELMTSIAIENKDRLAPYWKSIKNHIYRLLTCNEYFVIERAVVCLIRLVSRLLFREELAAEMLQSLSLLLLLSSSTLRKLSCQLACGLHVLLRSNAANIHHSNDWKLLFTLLEVAGVCAYPKDLLNREREHRTHNTVNLHQPGHKEGRRSESPDGGYTSDTELYTKKTASTSNETCLPRSGSAEWTYVEQKEGIVITKTMPTESGSAIGFDPQAIVLRKDLQPHESKAYLKCCETISFLVRDAAHITPENFESCVRCLRAFIEATINGGYYTRKEHSIDPKSPQSQRRNRKNAKFADHDINDEADEENKSKHLADTYHQVALQLLDLTHTLHVKASDIYNRWAQVMPKLNVSGASLWEKCWCPLLQALAKLCTDQRRQIRMSALTYLQRALLIHDLQESLESVQWEQCFIQVLFPLMAKLQDNINPMDPLGMEETRVRAITLLCKVFLQHLHPLSMLCEFPRLWVSVIDCIGQYYQSDRSDLLLEAIPESLKNMLLVMDTAGIFGSCPNIYETTRDRLSPFLPKLIDEVFPNGYGFPRQPLSSQTNQVNKETVSEENNYIAIAIEENANDLNGSENLVSAEACEPDSINANVKVL